MTTKRQRKRLSQTFRDIIPKTYPCKTLQIETKHKDASCSVPPERRPLNCSGCPHR